MTCDFWIQTHSGRKVSLVDPQPDDIDINDIAHALSLLCRFNGHCKVFYSVAQHSIHVSRLTPPGLELDGLLHDATECFVGDMVRPLKGLVRHYYGEMLDEIETRMWVAISAKFFGGEIRDLSQIVRADMVALATEKRDLLGPCDHEWMKLPDPDPRPIVPLSAAIMPTRFLNRFHELGGKP